MAMNHKSIPPAILAERRRQRTGEGWTNDHDDEHVDGSMRIVAQAYYDHAVRPRTMDWQLVPIGADRRAMRIPLPWPWGPKWWKPKTPARDLERAGALCLAEIDRLERRVDAELMTDEEGADHIKDVERLLGRIVKAYNALKPPAKPTARRAGAAA